MNINSDFQVYWLYYLFFICVSYTQRNYFFSPYQMGFTEQVGYYLLIETKESKRSISFP